jgi:hypothetical protein
MTHLAKVLLWAVIAYSALSIVVFAVYLAALVITGGER